MISGNETHLFVGGAFTTIGATTRNRIAAFNRTSKTLSAWNPNADNTVNAIRQNGATLYVGGLFSKINLITRKFIAALDTASNTPLSWDPSANGAVNALEISDTVLFAAGAFSGLGGYPRSYIGALNLQTGLITDWNPSASAAVNSLYLSRNCIGERLYVGGNFSLISNIDQKKLAAIINSVLPGITVSETIKNETCAGTFDGKISLTLSGGIEPYSFEWSDSSASQDISEISGGTYSVVILDSIGCPKADTFTVGSTNNPLAVADFDFTINAALVTFTDQSAGNPDAWFWNFGDDSTSTVSNPIHQFSGDSLFQVCLKVSNQCNSDSMCKEVEVDVTGFNESSTLNKQINVYPNPAQDFIFIENRSDKHDLIQCSVTDLTGRSLMDFVLLSNTYSTLDLTTLVKGIYLIRFSQNNQTSIRRICKL